METVLLTNAVGRVRRERLNGREYVVAPVSMIVPGVLNGSKGRLFYSPQETSRNVDAWNGVPLTDGHPLDDAGNPISARSPEASKSHLGVVYAANYQNKLVAEGWVDVELAKKSDRGKAILNKLDAGQRIELSTGLFTNNVKAPPGASYFGRPYDYVAKDYRPDHLAILLDQRGACSLTDGCGVLVNQESDDEPTANAPNQPRSKNTGRMKKYGAGTGKGPCHEHAQTGAYGPKPCECEDPTDCQCEGEMNTNAFCPTGPGGGQDNSCSSKEGPTGGGSHPLAGKSPYVHQSKPGDRVTVKPDPYTKGGQHKGKIGKIVKFHSGGNKVEIEFPDGTTSKFETSMLTHNAETRQMKKEQLVAYLTANCECWKGEDATLNEFDVKKLRHLVDDHKAAVTNAEVVEAVRNELDLADDEELTANAMPAFLAKKKEAAVAPEDDEEEEDDTEEMPVKNKKKPVANAAPRGWANMKEWMDDPTSAPAEVKALVANSARINQREKNKLIERLTANVAADRKKAVVATLNAKSVEELETLTALLPAPRPTANVHARGGFTLDSLTDNEDDPTETIRPSTRFLGSPGRVTVNKKGDGGGDALPLPRMSFKTSKN